MNVLVACEESQAVCKAFRKKGHRAFSCDILECSGGHPEWHIKQDCIPLLNGNCMFETMDGESHKLSGRWDLIIAHVPCTYFSNATNVNLGRKDYPEIFNEEWKKRFFEKREYMYKFFLKVWNSNCERIAIENVIGWLSTNFRKPTQIIQPFMFGQPYRKATCLWLYNLPKLKPTNIIEPTCKWVKHNLKTKDDLKGYQKKAFIPHENAARHLKV